MGGSMMGPGTMGPGMMGPGMGGMSSGDMSTSMEMFRRHGELRRHVEDIPGGVGTTTESDSGDFAAQLKAHVSAMYSHVDEGAEVMCMSDSLPTLFRRATDYQRRLTFTDKWGGRRRNHRRSRPDARHPRSCAGGHRFRHRRHARDDAGHDGNGRLTPQ